jgi:Fur family ferric uptake transcriptional regulator
MKGAKRDDREAFASLIRGAGLRVTSSRVHVLKALRGAEAPLSHADVATQMEALGLDRTTVYRNLVDLTEVGILRRTDVDHTWRFELVEQASGDAHETVQHPHFVCTDCGKVACLPAGVVALKPLRGSPQALRRGNLEIQLRGLCDACA